MARLYEDPNGVLPAWAVGVPGAYVDTYGQVRSAGGVVMNERNIGSFAGVGTPPQSQATLPPPEPPMADVLEEIAREAERGPAERAALDAANEREAAAERMAWESVLNPGSMTVGSSNRDRTPKDFSAFLGGGAGGGPSQADMLAAMQANQRNQQGALGAITGSPAYDILNSELGRMVLAQANNPQGLSAEERMARERMVRSTAENERSKALGDLQANISKRGFDGPAADAAIAQAKLGYSQMLDNQLAEIDLEDATRKREEQQRAFSQFSSLLANQQQARQNAANLQSNFGTPVFAGSGSSNTGSPSTPRATVGSQKQRDFFDKATESFAASGQDRFGRTYSGKPVFTFSF